MTRAASPPAGAPRGARAQALSNGSFTTVITEAGGGYSAFGDLRLTRWSADPLRPGDGVSVYLRDLSSGAFERLQAAEHARVELLPGSGSVARTVLALEVELRVCVDPDADAELRTITVRNPGPTARRVEVTTCAELVLNSAAADAAHPAFSKLFVQTDILPTVGGILAWRRPRSPEDEQLWLAHLLRLEDEEASAAGLQVETDRMRFIGRGRTLAAPAALTGTRPLSGTVGSVLDPVASLRRVVELGPGQSARVVAVTAAAASRDQVLNLARRHGAAQPVEPVFAAAAARATALMEELGIGPELAVGMPELTGALLFGAPAAGAAEAIRETSGQSFLLRDLGLGAAPLVVAVAGVGDAADAVALTRWWRRQGLPVDLLAVAGDPAEAAVLRERAEPGTAREPGSTVVLPPGEATAELLAHARAVARLVLGESGQPAISMESAHQDAPGAEPRFRPAGPSDDAGGWLRGDAEAERLQFFNGYGGFSANGREYVIRVEPRPEGPLLPPLPWTHVLANDQIGLIATERGPAHTWSANSRENRLTPWQNDPISDPLGEALYVRDEASGLFWSPTPGPVPAPAPYEVRWGLGYAGWRTDAFGLEQEVTAFVPRGAPLRLVRVCVRNRSREKRRLTVFSFAHWVLGVLPGESPFLHARVERDGRRIIARNPANGEYGGRIAMAAVVAPAASKISAMADRSAFLGRGGDPGNPAALRFASALDGAAGAGLDACAAFAVSLELLPGDDANCDFLLGQGRDEAECRAALRRYDDPDAVETTFAECVGQWSELLARIRVETPAPALDLVVNNWLGYQDLCCRILARTAYYQSGGAYGFRDQLQDAAALVYLDPELARHQIVLHAGHQFVEGDVLHWWHPPEDKGIRTRFSDDLLWLPYVATFYIGVTGDAGILDEPVPYVTARQLEPGEDEAFLFPEPAGEAGSVYEHCCLALDRSLTVGSHGLPLMGTGDWNDGMNRVGREGRGESVWLGFFLYSILTDFIPIVAMRGDGERMARYAMYREDLRRALNDGGWDGAWYRRAYYDDGAPLGSATSDECRIDAIAQAWSVLSGAAPPDRASAALDALELHLVREEDGLIALLTPPFDRTPHDPGYIKGYIPGVRENGGQYTHGALWAVRALAQAGRHERAARLLEMLSPVAHTRTAEEVAVYQVEPYVIAADVYGVAPHIGRGGWTWYTGSAGWMLRVALESVLGLTVEQGSTLRLSPCIPAAWPGFSIRYRLPGDDATYDIRVTRADLPTRATLDGSPVEVRDGAVLAPLLRDGRTHELSVAMGADVGPAYRPR